MTDSLKKIATALIGMLLPILLLSGCHKQVEPFTPVVLIGLDGATWNVMEPLLKAGRLPTFQRLIDNGAYGSAKSCCSTLSPAVWTTIVTGRDQTEHGIYDFTMTDPRTGQMTKVNNTHRQKKALWEILTAHGQRTGIVNLFVAWPFDKFDGFGYHIERGDSYPKDLLPPAERIRQEEPIPSLTFGISRKLAINPWDLMIVYDRTIDEVQHKSWMYLEPEKFDRNKWLLTEKDLATHQNDIPRAYEETDRAIGEFLQAVPSNATIMIVSDHGGQANNEGSTWYLLSTNKILSDCSLMKLDPGFLPLPGQSPLILLSGEKPALGTMWDGVTNYSVNVEAARATWNLPNATEPELREFAASKLRSLKVGKLNLPLFSEVAIADQQSPAPPAPGQKPALITVVRTKQNNILDQIRGDPDLLPVGPNGEGPPLTKYIVKTPSSGVHSEYGIVIISGPLCEKRRPISEASVYDITPTILAILGLPMASDMRGHVLSSAFTADFQSRLTAKPIKTYEDGKTKKARLMPLLPEEQKKLRELGYL